MSAPRTAALVPAYQAGATIAAVVSGTRAVLAPVVVVDDGSADDTAARAAAAGADVLRHAANQGKGAALVTGLRHLDAAGFERALTLDADGQHLPSEIPLLLAAADAAPGAIVVGVRRKEGFAIRRVARFGNWVADRFLRLDRRADRCPTRSRGFACIPSPRRSRSGRPAAATTSRPRCCCAPPVAASTSAACRCRSTIRRSPSA